MVAKCVSKHTIIKKKFSPHLLREIEISLKLKHPFINEFQYWYQDEFQIVLVMEHHPFDLMSLLLEVS